MAGGGVTIYDTTLRDGMQQEGLSVSVDEKVRIALRLDELGLDFIEGGFPASNPKEIAFFARMERERLSHAVLVAFGMTRRKGVAAADDPGLRVLAGASTPVVTIVGKTWGLHLRAVLHVSGSENLRMIDESVGFLATTLSRRCAWPARPAPSSSACATPTAAPCRRPWSAWSPRSLAGSARRWACTVTTTPTARWPTRSWPWPPAPSRCRAP
jgi:hypothetical protein